MKTIKILVNSDGMGREANPYHIDDAAPYYAFETRIEELPAFTPDNKPAEPGTYEAILMWQENWKRDSESDHWVYCSSKPNGRDPMRQVYRIIQPKEKAHPQQPKVEQQGEGEPPHFGEICNRLFGYKVWNDTEFYTYQEAAKEFAIASITFQTAALKQRVSEQQKEIDRLKDVLKSIASIDSGLIESKKSAMDALNQQK